MKTPFTGLKKRFRERLEERISFSILLILIYREFPSLTSGWISLQGTGRPPGGNAAVGDPRQVFLQLDYKY
jgi:hypothetical protein